MQVVSHFYTLHFMSFANWAIKNIPGNIPIYIGLGAGGEYKDIEIDSDTISESTFISARILDKVVEIIFGISMPDGTKSYIKKIYTESPESPYETFIKADCMLD